MISFYQDGGLPVGGHVKEISEKDFSEEVLKSKSPVVVDFWASWCGPCVAAAPQFEKFAKKYAGKAKFAKISLDDNANERLAGKYHITGIPAFLFFKDGKVADRSEGFGARSPEIWEKLLAMLL